MAEPSPTNAGDGKYSYAKNSEIQGALANGAKDIINEMILEHLDVKGILTNSSTFSIVDLGCACGPNTFFSIKNIINSVESKYISQGLDPETLKFQVFFNDQTTNDFNTLFRTLPPNREYFVAGVPGSFHTRLFPSSSIHFAYSSSSLHWLSKAPGELLIKNSPTWNGGKIHYMGASNEVANAYAAQFEKDMDMFLSARGEEIIQGGMMVIIVPGIVDGVLMNDVGYRTFNILGSILMEMVDEGVLDQDQVDTFNIPMVYPSCNEMTRLVEKNGYCNIEKMITRNLETNVRAAINMESGTMLIRAALEGTFSKHLGSHIVDQMFERLVQQKHKFPHLLDSIVVEAGTQLVAVLKRKSNQM